MFVVLQLELPYNTSASASVTYHVSWNKYLMSVHHVSWNKYLMSVPLVTVCL